MKVPTVTSPSVEMNDSSSQFTRDSSTLEHQAGITKLYPHQSLGVSKIHVPSDASKQIQQNDVNVNNIHMNNDAESTSSSLPHVHYPMVHDEQNASFWNTSVVSNRIRPNNTVIGQATPIISTQSSYSTPCTTSSYDEIPSAAPVRSACDNSTCAPAPPPVNHEAVNATDTSIHNHGYSRQISGNSLVSTNSLGVNSLRGGNSLTSTSMGSKSTAQSVLDLSTKSLADALIPHDEEGSYCNEEDASSHSIEGSLALATARPIDECSEGGNSAPSMNLMELKQALPMGESEDEDNGPKYGFGRDGEMSRGERIHRPLITKPVLPQSFPSLLDSSMSSSYSVSAPPSATPSFDNCGDVQREGSKEEREDTLSHQISQVIAAPPQAGCIEEPLAIEVPLPMPMTTDGSRYIVDLEQIVEESSGQDMGELSVSSPGSSGVRKNAPLSAATSKNAEGIAEQWHQEQQVVPGDCQVVDENHPMPAERPDQQVHRNPNHQFFNYRHQYYTEQYHYFDGEKYSSKGGDDDTDSTCSSVTLSHAFDRSVHGDDGSCAECSYTTGASSHPTLSTVSSVTLSQALSVDRHDHSDQGFYVAVRLGDYNEGQNDEEIEVESVRGDEISRVDVEERDVETEQKSKTDSKADNDSNDPSEVSSPGAAEDVLSDAPAAANKEITQSTERVESDILNMLIPECGVPIPGVMSKMGKQRSKGGMLLPWHSTRSIQNYQYGGGRRKKRNVASNSSLFSISSVHTFRG
jgi:hypothetical protein